MTPERGARCSESEEVLLKAWWRDTSGNVPVVADAHGHACLACPCKGCSVGSGKVYPPRGYPRQCTLFETEVSGRCYLEEYERG